MLEFQNEQLKKAGDFQNMMFVKWSFPMSPVQKEAADGGKGCEREIPYPEVRYDI